MFDHILLSVDLGDRSSWSKALPTAVELAKTHDATLHVVTVVPDFGMAMVGQYFSSDHADKVMADTNERLHALVREHVPSDIRVQHNVELGSIYERILATAERVKADLIVIASHRPELSDYLLGPNAARVVRHADCSVLVVRQ